MRRRVLVPCDGSCVPDSVVSAILRIAGDRQVEALLVRVVEPAPADTVDGSRRTAVKSTAARMDEARQSMTRSAARLRAYGLRVTTHVRRGSPAPEILAAAREAEVDFIAMATQGRDAPGRAGFDAVAEAVCRGAEVPVLLVPLAGRRRGARTGHAGGVKGGSRVA